MIGKCLRSFLVVFEMLSINAVRGIGLIVKFNLSDFTVKSRLRVI